MKLWIVAFLTLFSAAGFAQQSFKQTYQRFQDALAEEDYQNAISLGELAVEQGAKKFGSDDINTINLQYSLANTYLLDRKYAKALRYYRQIESQYLAHHGESSFQAYQLGLQIMVAQGRTDNYSSAEKQRRLRKLGANSLELAEQLVAENAELAAPVYSQFVTACRELGIVPFKLEKLAEVVEKAEHYALDIWGDNDVRTLEIQFYLAQIYKAGEQNDNAIEKYESLVSTVSDAVSFSHPFELGAHARLVELYEQSGDSEKATEHCLAIGRMTPWKDDIEPMPLYRKDPIYPGGALRSGAEGWVVMSFDITPMGFVDNINVVDSQGGGRFERAATKALKLWRYAPKFVAGQAAVDTGKRVKLDFRLSN